jgi:hypothetical protein
MSIKYFGPYAGEVGMSSNNLVDVAIAAMATIALAACISAPPGNNAVDIDLQYGIPVDSVPSYLLRPDGLMTNGLLPAQPNG